MRRFDTTAAGRATRTFLSICAVPLLFVVLASGQGTIETIAGNGQAAYVDGPALNASFNEPVMMDFASDGGYYVADITNHRIRKVSADGNVTTVAGTGAAGYNGDNQPALNASLNQPTDVVVDSQGNLFVADAANNRIRKIDTNGMITTFAGNGVRGFGGDGGQAAGAMLACPVRLWLDSFDTVYIADQCNHRVRRVDGGGTITTVVGSGAAFPTGGSFSGDGGLATQAAFNNITAVALDGTGNMIVTDQSNHRIRRINRNGIVTTILGTGAQGFSGDGGLATAATTRFPGSVATDSVGNVYFGDTLANRVRRIDTSGIVTTVVGTGAAATTGNGGPPSAAAINEAFGIEIDPFGNLYVIESGGHVIRKVTGLLPAAPSFPPNAGTNAANYRTGLQFGSISTVFGVNLSTVNGIVQAPPGVFPLPLQVGGTSVTVNGFAAPIFAVVRVGVTEQVNFLTPFEAAPALSEAPVAKGVAPGSGPTAEVVITSNGLSSAPVLIPVTAADPGIFVVGAAGEGAVAHLNGTLVTQANPALPGEALQVYCTGLGPVSNPPEAGQPALGGEDLSQMPVFPTATIGGTNAQVIFGGLAPNFVGLYQVNLIVPAGVQPGVLQLVVTLNGVASNSVPLAIAAN